MIFDPIAKENSTSEIGLPELISIKDAMKYIGCGKTKMYELVKRTDFPCWKIGGQYRIDKYELLKWIKQGSA